MSKLLFLTPVNLKNEIFGHTTIELTENDKKYVVIIGGHYFDHNEKINLQFYSIEEEEIIEIEQQGNIPKSRLFHSSVLLNENIYIFGGLNLKMKSISNSCFIFDTSKFNFPFKKRKKEMVSTSRKGFSSKIWTFQLFIKKFYYSFWRSF